MMRPVRRCKLAVSAHCISRIVRSSSVKGNSRPSRFFVLPGARRTTPASKSTWCHCSVKISLGTRQKRDQIGYLFRLGRPAERNAAKRIHDDLSTTLVVGGVLPRELGDETYSAVSLDPAGRDTDDAHPLGTHFLGTAPCCGSTGPLSPPRRLSSPLATASDPVSR